MLIRSPSLVNEIIGEPIAVNMVASDPIKMVEYLRVVVHVEQGTPLYQVIVWWCGQGG